MSRKLWIEVLEERIVLSPVLNDDIYSIQVASILHKESLEGVFANDTEVAGLQAILVKDVDHGRLSLASSGAFAYAPHANVADPTQDFHGVDTFTYGLATGEQATVTILVGAPTVVPNEYTVGLDTPLQVAAPGALGDDAAYGGGTLTFEVLACSHGDILSHHTGAFMWVPPDPTWSGTVVVDYRAWDSAGAWADSTITIYVGVQQGFQGDVEITQPGSEAEASWTFAVDPGFHKVFATWPTRSGAATNVPYSIKVDGVLVDEVLVNQRRPPDDVEDKGVKWEYLTTVEAQSEIVVSIREDKCDGPVFADAARIERLGQPRQAEDTTSEVQARIVTRAYDWRTPVTDGPIITHADPGETFVVTLEVRDGRPEPAGVAAAWLDLSWIGGASISYPVVEDAFAGLHESFVDNATGRLSVGGVIAETDAPIGAGDWEVVAFAWAGVPYDSDATEFVFDLELGDGGLLLADGMSSKDVAVDVWDWRLGIGESVERVGVIQDDHAWSMWLASQRDKDKREEENDLILEKLATGNYTLD